MRIQDALFFAWLFYLLFVASLFYVAIRVKFGKLVRHVTTIHYYSKCLIQERRFVEVKQKHCQEIYYQSLLSLVVIGKYDKFTRYISSLCDDLQCLIRERRLKDWKYQQNRDIIYRLLFSIMVTRQYDRFIYRSLFFLAVTGKYDKFIRDISKVRDDLVYLIREQELKHLERKQSQDLPCVAFIPPKVQ